MPDETDKTEGWETPDSATVDITLPDGSTISETTDASGGPTRSTLRDRDGKVVRSWDSDDLIGFDPEEPPEAETARKPVKKAAKSAKKRSVKQPNIFPWGHLRNPKIDPSTPEPARQRWWRLQREGKIPKKVVVGGMAVLIAAGIAYFSAGGTSTDGSDQVSVVDPLGDLEDTWPGDFDGILEPNPAGDLVGMSATTNGRELVGINLRFGGNAQGLASIPGEELSGDILVIPPDGGRVLDFLIRTDGTIKGADLPPGMGVLASWVTPEEYAVELSGLIVESGTEVTFRSIQEYRGDFSSDSASLVIP